MPVNKRKWLVLLSFAAITCMIAVAALLFFRPAGFGRFTLVRTAFHSTDGELRIELINNGPESVWVNCFHGELREFAIRDNHGAFLAGKSVEDGSLERVDIGEKVHASIHIPLPPGQFRLEFDVFNFFGQKQMHSCSVSTIQ